MKMAREMGGKERDGWLGGDGWLRERWMAKRETGCYALTVTAIKVKKKL